MPAQRIKGQEISIIVVSNGAYEDTLTDVQDFHFEIMTELKTAGYLGEKTQRNDEVFNGVKFDMKMHHHSQDFFKFAGKVVARAKRLQPNLVFNISGIFSYPNGDTPTILLPDAHFGPTGNDISDRGSFAEGKITGQCDDYFPTFT